MIESIWTSDSSDILGKFEGPPSMCSKVEVWNLLILCPPAQFKIKVDGSETKLSTQNKRTSVNKLLTPTGKVKGANGSNQVLTYLIDSHSQYMSLIKLNLATLQLKQSCFCGDWINPFFGGNSGMISLCLLACCTVSSWFLNYKHKFMFATLQYVIVCLLGIFSFKLYN